MPKKLRDRDITALSRDEETRRIHRVAGYAFLLNLGLALMKGILAFFSGSLVITAGAIDSGTDAVASIVIYGGVKLSARKTRSFPMGLYKLENLASVVIALFIFIAGYEVMREVFSQEGHSIHISLPYILLLLVGTAAVFMFGEYAISIGKKTGSPTLIAEGRHRQVDFLSSVVVLVSVILSYLNLPLSLFGITIDQLGAALILLFIVRAGWELLSDGMRVLLDASLDFTTLNRIREIIKDEPMVSDIKTLYGRNSGRFRFIQATISLKTKDLPSAHQISRRLEAEIRRQVTHVEKVMIRYEPEESPYRCIGLPLEDKTGRINMHFGEAPYFGIVCVGKKDGEIKQQDIMENPFRMEKTAKGIRVAEWLVEQKVEDVGMKEDLSHKGPGYVLSNAHIKIHVISADHLHQALREIILSGKGDDLEF